MKQILIKYRIYIIVLSILILGAIAFFNIRISTGRGVFVLIGLPYPIHMIYAFLWEKDMFWLGSIPANSENSWLRWLVFLGVFIYIFGFGLSTYKAFILK